MNSSVNFLLGDHHMANSVTQPWARSLACVAAVIAVLPATAAEPALEPISGCPAWCLAQFARSWACQTVECAPCLRECLSVPLPTNVTTRPRVNGHSFSSMVMYTEKEDTWSCAPVWPPQRLFVLFATPRTGSTTACGVINSLPK